MNFREAADLLWQKKLTDEVLVRNVHFDRFSKEKSTNVVKPKYKLLTRKDHNFDVYFFYALTTTVGACPERAKIEIRDSDYESKDLNHLKKGISYINLEKVVVEDSSMIISRFKSSDNHFDSVARINQSKFIEIKEKGRNVRYSNEISNEVRDIVLVAAHDADITSDFISKFQI